MSGMSCEVSQGRAVATDRNTTPGSSHHAETSGNRARRTRCSV